VSTKGCAENKINKQTTRTGFALTSLSRTKPFEFPYLKLIDVRFGQFYLFIVKVLIVTGRIA